MVEVELHRKLEGKKPRPPCVKLQEILVDNPVDHVVSRGRMGWWSIEDVLKRVQSIHVKANRLKSWLYQHHWSPSADKAMDEDKTNQGSLM